MSTLQQKFNTFLSALREKVKEKDPDGTVNVQHCYSGGVDVIITINDKTDSYWIGENQHDVWFERYWNGVL